MNALAKSIQDDDLRFSPGLFLSGLKSHKLNRFRSIARSASLIEATVLRVCGIPQELVEALKSRTETNRERNASRHPESTSQAHS